MINNNPAASQSSYTRRVNQLKKLDDKMVRVEVAFKGPMSQLDDTYFDNWLKDQGLTTLSVYLNKVVRYSKVVYTWLGNDSLGYGTMGFAFNKEDADIAVLFKLTFAA